MATRIIYPALENYQRTWRDYRVDNNLEDDWLVRLNNLGLFYVVNVCEGHYTCEDQYPAIVLLGRPEAVNKLEGVLADREWTLQLFNGTVSADTEFNFFTTKGISSDPDSFYNGSKIKLSFFRNEPRESLEFDRGTFEWFEKTVDIIEVLDGRLQSRLN